MKPLYCTESQDRIPFEYFAQGKAIWSGGKPYLTRVAMELGLKPDAGPPASHADYGASGPTEGAKAGLPPMKVVNPKATSSMEMAAIPGSTPAIAVLPQIPKQDAPAAPAAASTVMGPGVKGDEGPAISPPPIYVKSKGTAIGRPLPPPPDEDKLDPTVPEVNVKERKVLPSPLEAPTLTAGAAAAQMPKQVSGMPKPPAPDPDAENTPTITSTPAPVAEQQPVSKPVEAAPAAKAVSEDPALNALNAQVEQAQAEQAKLDADIAAAEERVAAAQTSLNELNRKMLVDAESVEGTLAQGKAREKEEATYRTRIEELIKIEADAKAQMESAAKERAELEEKARAISISRAKADMEIKQKRQAENRLKGDLEMRQRLAKEAEDALASARKAKADSLEKVKSAEAELAKAKAAEEAKKAEAEKAAKERAAAVEKARKEAEEKAKKEAAEKAKKEEEERLKREAEELNKAERELQEKLEAIQKARRDAEERAKKGGK